MEKVKIANYSERQLNILYEKYKEENDVVNLLSVLFKMLKNTKNPKSVYYEIAKTYFSIEMFEKAKEYFFRLLDFNDEYYNLRAYNGLGASFYKMNDDLYAGYYFDKQINTNNEEYCIYNDLATEFFNEIYNRSNNYYLAYPYEKADFTNLLNNSSVLIGRGEFEKAIETLKIIPKNSKFYENKLLQIGISKYFLKDYCGAIDYINQAIEVSENKVIPLLNALNISFDMKDIVNHKKYLEEFSKIDLGEDYENILKAFLIFCEIYNYKKAKSLGEKYLKKYPNNYLVSYFLGITYLNLKDFEKAKITFSKCMQLDANFINKTYYELACDEKLSKSILKESGFKYSFDIPPQKKVAILKIIMLLSSLESLNKEEKAVLNEYFNYAILIELQPFSLKVFDVYFNKISKFTKAQLEDIFLSTKVSDTTKKEIIKRLILNDVKGSFGCVLSNVYSKIKLALYEFDGENGEFFKRAFSIACCKVILSEKYVKKLYETSKKIFDTLSFFNLTSLYDDVNTLSAMFYELFGEMPISKRRELSQRFNANLRTLKRYKETYFNCLEKLNENI